jgi:hypothetical protein
MAGTGADALALVTRTVGHGADGDLNRQQPCALLITV